MNKYEMTYKQFCENWLNNSSYKQAYLDEPEIWKGVKENLKRDWVKILLERAKVGSIPSDVIMSYIRLFGESDLFRTFRGVYEKGIQDFRIPKSIRDLRKEA